MAERVALRLRKAHERLGPFEHAITTAYYWPVDLLTSEVEVAGFAVTHTESRELGPARSHGAILATRS